MRRYSFLRLGINIGAFLLLGMGLVVIYGWFIGSVSLIQIQPQFVPMQFNTALGFVLIGFSLLGFINHRRKLVKYLGLVLVLLGGLTLAQHIFGVNLGIDELFMKHYITIATSQPGRMAPNTALSFLLSGSAILTMSKPKIGVHQLLICSVLGSLIMGLGTVAYFGYLSKVETAYGWGNLTKMALHTSIGFIVVGLLVIIAIRHLSWRIQKKMSSLVLPITSGVLGFTVTLCLWQALYSSELYVKNQYGIKPTNFVAEGILVVGGLFSIVIVIATWFAIRSHEQLQALKLAQAEILALNKQLEKISYLDGLTEIPNRRAFDIAIENELGRASRYQHSVALILFDIDYFKSYNDYYGHQMGDRCLQQVAHTINTMAKRKTDIAARYGGEEFVLLLPDAAISDATRIAAITLQAIANLQIPHKSSKVSDIVTLSAGVSVCIPNHHTTSEELIWSADQALYEAKAQGRARVVAMT